MNIAFRTDASLQIGSGHVMRCLTLADALKARGARCHFICREHPGHLLEMIGQRGHLPHPLPLCPRDRLTPAAEDSLPDHAGWLGCSWRDDAAQTRKVLTALQPEWLVVDHYALDVHWERSMRPYCRSLMVVDDLADRKHDCDLLLDQTLGRRPEEYAMRVPMECTILVGSEYALLRPEFVELRARSLQRRKTAHLRRLLVSMGGVDQSNATGHVLEALRECTLPAGCRITVVVGQQSPWLEDIKQQALKMPWPTEIRENVSDMAQLMADSDLAIGAAGGTSWERCCLGLPTLMLIVAENQRTVASALVKAGAAYLLGDTSRIDLGRACRDGVLTDERIREISGAASEVTDGNGVSRVMNHLDMINGKRSRSV